MYSQARLCICSEGCKGAGLTRKYIGRDYLMGSLKKSEILVIGLMMFSIFFGAGNLIFPPALGQAAGANSSSAIMGFLLTGVGLPLIGIVAIAFQGGKYTEFISDRIHPWFALVLLSVLYLTIGPLFAVPRTGAVSFEIGIKPFLTEDGMMLGQAIYTALFFAATCYLALTPSKLVDRVGKILTPVLLLFLVVLFAKSFITPLGDIIEATGTYVTSPFAQGFQDGYLTMDLLASIAVGSIVVSSIRLRGVEDKKEISKICIMGGIIAIFCMSLVYLSLCYIGATSASVLGHSANGGKILADAAGIFFGPMGNIILAVIIAFACLTTSCGMVSASAGFFNKVSKNRFTYKKLVVLFSVFGFATSNVGLTALIKFSVPFLTAIYPIVIVLVILSLFDGFIKERSEIYRRAIDFTLVFAVIDGLNAAGFNLLYVNEVLAAYVPFYSVMMGWLVPAIIGAGLGYLQSLFRTSHAVAGEMEKAE